MPSAAPYSAGRPSPASASPAMAASSSTSVWSGMQLGLWRSIAGLRSSQAPTTGASRAHIASPVAAYKLKVIDPQGLLADVIHRIVAEPCKAL